VCVFHTLEVVTPFLENAYDSKHLVDLVVELCGANFFSLARWVCLQRFHQPLGVFKQPAPFFLSVTQPQLNLSG
jgi:hypothetical protein